MKNSILHTIATAATILVLSGCSTTQTDPEERYYAKADLEVTTENPWTVMLRDDLKEEFSPVHFANKNKATLLVKNKVVELLTNKITLENNGKMLFKGEKTENKYLIKTTDWGVFLKTSFEDTATASFRERGSDAVMKKELTLLDTEIKNLGEKNTMGINPESIQYLFPRAIAFWYPKSGSAIKPQSSVRVVLVLGGTENFKVKKKQGSTLLKFDTKRVIENKTNEKR